MADLPSGRDLIAKIQSESWRGNEEMAALLEGVPRARAEQILPLLFHRVPQVRQIAAQSFVGAADEKAATRLLEACVLQRAPQARAFGLKVLVAVAPEILKPAVETGIRAKDLVRQAVAWEAALQLPGEVGRQYAEQALENAPAHVRLLALDALLAQVSATALKTRLLQLLSDDDERVSARALQALSTVDDVEVFAAMLDRLSEAKGTVRDAIAGYLKRYAAAHPVAATAPMMMAMAGDDEAVRRLSIQILFATASPAQVLQNILVHARGLAPWLRKRVTDILKTLGDQILLPAISLVDHEDEAVRHTALALADEFADPRLVEPLCRLLTHDDWWLRISACESLGRLQDRRAVPALLKALSDEDTQWAAIDALAQVGAPEALEPIAAMAYAPRPEVRLEALAALVCFNDPKVQQLLEHVAQTDASLEVRTRAGELIKKKRPGSLATTPLTQLVRVAGETPLEQLLIHWRLEGASDIHLTPGEPPMVRTHGILRRASSGVVSAAQIDDVLLPMLSEAHRVQLEQRGDLDLCYAIDEVGRYRANVYRTRLGLNACFRVIPILPPTFSDLLLPDALADITTYHQGLVLVAGPAGSGKSTTLAALVNLINEAKPLHIITLEDPVEFVHPQKTALVNQREIGKHTRSFASALRGALRQDPDVIMVGELRDAETTRMSLEAAETGHLVIATMPTTSAVATVDRLIGSFPPEEQGQVQMALSESLKWVVSQSLLRRRDQQGRVAVFEILKGTMSVAGAIREGKTLSLAGAMQTGRSVGMQNLDHALEQHVQAGRISAEDAYLRAQSPVNFEALCSPEFLAGLQVAGAQNAPMSDRSAKTGAVS